MGLFDKLIKDVKDAINSEDANKIKEGLQNFVDNDLKNVAAESSSNMGGKTIPEEYSHFPVFESELGEVKTKVEKKYKRCTMKYYKATEDEIEAYRDKIVGLGYEKMTDVRYEKDNEYIIVDNNVSPMEVVFHVKF